MLSFKIDGISGLRAGLRQIQEFTTESTRLAVAKAAHLVEANAKRKAPVVTGNLRRSITVDGPVQLSVTRFAATVGPNAVYGSRVEFGFHGTDSLGRNYDQAGHPYMIPAFTESIPEIGAVFTSAWTRSTQRLLGL